MNQSKATVLIFLLLMASFSFGQQTPAPASESSNLRNFTEVKGLPEDMPASFEFSISGYKYTIAANGRGRRAASGVGVRLFNLRLHTRDVLQRNIYHAQYDGDVLLVCEVSDGEGGAGFIIRLDSRTLRMKWRREIPAFNVGRGLVEGDYAYLTAIGFVAKLNLKSGAYVWKHDDLYRDGDFNSIKLPRVEGDAVFFQEEVIYNEPAKTIKVQKQSGKIISSG